MIIIKTSSSASRDVINVQLYASQWSLEEFSISTCHWFGANSYDYMWAILNWASSASTPLNCVEPQADEKSKARRRSFIVSSSTVDVRFFGACGVDVTFPLVKHGPEVSLQMRYWSTQPRTVARVELWKYSGEPLYSRGNFAVLLAGNTGSSRSCGYKMLWDDMNINVTGYGPAVNSGSGTKAAVGEPGSEQWMLYYVNSEVLRS